MLTVAQFSIENNSSLVSPAARHIADSVATASEHEGWHVETLHKLNALCVSVQRQVEATQPITSQRVSTALEDNRAGLVPLHNFRDELRDVTLDYYSKYGK